MELEFFWSRFAEDKLQDIFQYSKLQAGTKTARKVVERIVDSTLHLRKNPKIGTTE